MLNWFQHLVCFFLPSADAPFIPVHRMGFPGATLNNQNMYQFSSLKQPLKIPPHLPLPKGGEILPPL